MTLIIAHRGASKVEMENSAAAFRRAGEMGADGIELDVRRTADDRLAVHHDANLADGRLVRDAAFSDLPDGVLCLGEALDACEGMFVNIEIKNFRTDGDFDENEWVANRTISELVARGSDRRWLISSFRYNTIEVCRRLAPSIPTAWLVSGFREGFVERAAAGGHVAIHPDVAEVTAESVRRAHALGLAVNVWTCDDPERMRELIGWGVDGICTNVPDVALRVRAGESG